MTSFRSAHFLKKMNYFLYMLMKITDGRTEGRKVFQKSKGRRELHRGLLWVQTIFRLRFLSSIEALTAGKDSFRLFSSCLCVILVSAAKTCLSWLAEVDTEGQGGGAS